MNDSTLGSDSGGLGWPGTCILKIDYAYLRNTKERACWEKCQKLFGAKPTRDVKWADILKTEGGQDWRHKITSNFK